MEAESSKGKSQSYSLKSKADLRERAYRYSVQVIRFLGSLPEKRLFTVVVNQLLRSATSIGANVVEAKSASSKKDFIRYYEIALKSANETRYWLGLLRDALDIDSDELRGISKELRNWPISLRQAS